MDKERGFIIELEGIMDRVKAIEVLIIGEPNKDTKWLVSLRIAEMIREYNNSKLNKQAEILFSFLLEDIHILRIQPFRVEGMASYFTSERAKQKNFIYVSHEGLSENKKLEVFVMFYVEAISRTKDKLKCNIIVGKEKKEIEFSYPSNDLIEEYRKVRIDAFDKVLKK
ncbi:hypothetical protein LCGC14_1873030 [marine sediment metagenome]|uniref:Uncharacterized protein n=1 Tax=marine sediment metagenome TaxID=412755 RepID=A0A0F9G4K0_9ZZZZ